MSTDSDKKLFKTFRQQDDENMTDPEWQKNNLEYDLRSTKWICDKVKAYHTYAQNLYAAMCNNQFQKLDVVPILKEQHWSCSWRYSGGIIADMRGEGEYLDWYCSGIGNQEDGYGLDAHKPELDENSRCYIPEGVITDEIRADLRNLDWIPLPLERE